ncbi:MAG: DUF5990 family protein [Caulobacteraceae bacterium]
MAPTPNPAASELRLRLIRDGDTPATNPLADEFAFGLQDIKQQIHAGKRRADGKLVWDFTVTVKTAATGNGPVFGGLFASGPASDRFVYLSWRSLERGDYINRVKARLGDIDWPLIRAAQAAALPLVADLTGRSPGGGRISAGWRPADD